MKLALIRLGYRVAWRMLWLLAPLHRGRGRGVKAVLTHEGHVLLVRHTYGPRLWELPGGGLHRDEPPAEGIRREVREELGIDLTAARLVAVTPASRRHTRRPVTIFTAEIDPATVTIDEREIARAEWFDPKALPGGLGWQVPAAVLALAGAEAEVTGRAGDRMRLRSRRAGRGGSPEP